MDGLLIVGHGDIARRMLAAGAAPGAVAFVSRRHGRDLDRPGTLDGLAGAARVLYTAPPPATGETDPRLAGFLAALARGRILPRRFVYIGTSGVYGDCGGARVDETRRPDPRTARARRRLDAEAQLARWCAAHGAALVVLRAPGIYAADRLPLERLREGLPALRAQDDVFTNHVHADDLAAIAARALEDDAAAGIYNASDDSEILMGDWLDLVADRCGLARPPRVARTEAEGRIPAARRSFMGESRRLDNRRLKEALGIRLRYPTVFDGVPERIQA